VGVGGECFVEHLGVYAAVWKPKNFEPCPPGAAGGGEYDDAHAKRSVNDISAVDFFIWPITRSSGWWVVECGAV